MSFLTIQEPSSPQTPAFKARKKRAVGIDLGTTHSLIACDTDGEVTVLQDDQNEVLLPSVVRYLVDGTVEVGKKASAFKTVDPANTIASAKRLLGRSALEVADKAFTQGYIFSGDTASVAHLRTVQGSVTPVDAAAAILKKLLERIPKWLVQDHQILSADEGVEAVITVPAYFNETQRQATKQAALQAGIKVLRLLNEPTAAAIAYGLDAKAKGRCLIYDLGGGTFDVSLLSLHNGVFEVCATGGDTTLGGDDFDEIIAHWCIKELQLNKEAVDFPRFLEKAKLAKEALSTEIAVEIDLRPNGILQLTRALLDTLLSPLVHRTVRLCERLLQDAQCDQQDLNHVVLVGGSTRLPLVQKALEKALGHKPLSTLDPEKVVAIGAALQASALVGDRRGEGMLLLDVTPLSLGLEVMGGMVEKIIPRNTSIPAKVTQTFTTFQDGQTGLLLHVLQGERELVSQCRSLARFELKGIPALPAGKARVEVTFQIDADGLLQILAKELTSGLLQRIEVKPSFGLTQEEVNHCIREAIEHASGDLDLRRLQEKKIEGEALLARLTVMMETGKGLLTHEQDQRLQQSIQQVLLALAQPKLAILQEAIAHLEEQTAILSALCLNASLQEAVEGKSVKDLAKLLS